MTGMRIKPKRVLKHRACSPLILNTAIATSVVCFDRVDIAVSTCLALPQTRRRNLCRVDVGSSGNWD